MSLLRFSGATIWLTALWVLLWGDLSAANVLAGVAVAVLVLTLARLPRLVRPADDDAIRIDPVATLRFGLLVAYDLVKANLILTWEIVTPRNRIHTGVIAVPLRTDSSTAMMVVANVITLTPGTMTIEVVGHPPVLYVHVLHLDDIETVRSELLRIEELSVRAFGTRAARAQLAERAGRAR